MIRDQFQSIPGIKSITSGRSSSVVHFSSRSVAHVLALPRASWEKQRTCTSLSCIEKLKRLGHHDHLRVWQPSVPSDHIVPCRSCAKQRWVVQHPLCKPSACTPLWQCISSNVQLPFGRLQQEGDTETSNHGQTSPVIITAPKVFGPEARSVPSLYCTTGYKET